MTDNSGHTVADSPESELELLPLQPMLEAVLFAADEPIDYMRLAQIVNRPPDDVVAGLNDLCDEYDWQGRGFQLREVARGWRLFTREAFAPAVERFVRDDHHAKLSQAALETLAIVAYQQPVSRSRISAVRGVSVDAVVRNLVQRGLLVESGTDQTSGAVLYSTSDYFLERMGLSDLDELPELAPLLPALDDLNQSVLEVSDQEMTASAVDQLNEDGHGD